ncbi:MAG TPA: alpha/beta fold hydrolase [Acidimicrobiales bacterium]|jgi:pimeloyl-ACP methyl ester carboxylesterase|nr:alpha/beta fold hydrolase [Acidimicrobiales bacterium]
MPRERANHTAAGPSPVARTEAGAVLARIATGADAGSAGLPRRRDLPLAARALVAGSAVADIGLRTAAASMVTASIVPLTTNPRRVRRERERLGFYADLATHHDPERSFPRPTARPDVRRAGAGRLHFRFPDGVVERLTFESPFVAVNPELRSEYASFRRNRIAHAQHWRHDDGPRPTLLVIHGFMGSPYLLNGAFFSLPWFFRAGWDVLLFTLPFHGARQERTSPFSGAGYFSHGLGVLSEAMAHAMHDLRLFIDHLESTGVEQVGVTGISLGGYTTALLAAVEPRLAVAVPNVPVTDMATVMADWKPAGTLLGAASRVVGMSDDDVRAGMAFHSPLNYPAAIAKDRRFVICGLGDRLAPPEQAELLWEHWDRCKFHWFPGNHVLHVNQASYLRRMARFMRDRGFAPPTWLDPAA